MEKLFGFVVIDKPAGLTSHDCVNRLRKIFNIKKVGHGGTLDPSVTGVLPMAIGNATRLIPFLKGSKAYKGVIQLGSSTNTDDMQGEVIESKRWPILSKNNLNNLLDSFRGEILQRPPIFSSVHFEGERAYKKARKGEKFALNPKKITINKLILTNWSQTKGELVIEVDCSSGTYIRSLARDIGDNIGCGAFLKSLRRTKAYSFNENHSILLPDKAEFHLTKNKPKILNPSDFLEHLSSFKLSSEEDVISWRSGRKIHFKNHIDRLLLPKKDTKKDTISDKKKVLVFDQDKNIAGIAYLEDDFIISPKVVFNAIG